MFSFLVILMVIGTLADALDPNPARLARARLQERMAERRIEQEIVLERLAEALRRIRRHQAQLRLTAKRS